MARGPLVSSVPGRTDHIPVHVAPNSYVIPADVVSAIGEGNSLAGHRTLGAMFNQGPRGMPIRHGRFAKGGNVGSGEPVPILASGGEHILGPDQVTQIGHGDVHLGHRILDAMVLHLRKKNIKTLKNLKPPHKK
jgi:hypothetical protein